MPDGTIRTYTTKFRVLGPDGRWYVDRRPYYREKYKAIRDKKKPQNDARMRGEKYQSAEYKEKRQKQRMEMLRFVAERSGMSQAMVRAERSAIRALFPDPEERLQALAAKKLLTPDELRYIENRRPMPPETRKIEPEERRAAKSESTKRSAMRLEEWTRATYGIPRNNFLRKRARIRRAMPPHLAGDYLALRNAYAAANVLSRTELAEIASERASYREAAE